ncbi:MAG TPA: hypothetical protein VF487_19665 [Chitinophagaceae bacterium]
MKILELIKHLKTFDKAEQLKNKQLPNVEFDLAELYMENSLSLDSNIRFFDSEKISNDLEMEVEGIKYVNLFPLYLAQEMIEEFTKSTEKKYSDLEIANRLLEYRINDA